MYQNYPEFEVLDLGLVLYKNVIPNPELVIEKINKLDDRFMSNEHSGSQTSVRAWQPWEYEDLTFCEKKYLPQPDLIPAQDFYFKEMLEISNALYDSLDVAKNHYADVLYPHAGRNIKGREFNIDLLRYKTGGYLPAHQDQGVSTRILSTVSYLNDDYVGGEIEFVNSKVKIKPPAGSIIFFPSNYLYVHEVHPIVSGERYSLPHWFHNRKDFLISTGEE
jgi:Rps23 Pro-64 3,4-dihydroxylase Tpa1-like proline 4-hydroxylase